MFLCLAAWGACQSGDGETVESCPTFAGNLETLESELGAFLEDMTTGGEQALVCRQIGMNITVTQVTACLNSLCLQTARMWNVLMWSGWGCTVQWVYT